MMLGPIVSLSEDKLKSGRGKPMKSIDILWSANYSIQVLGKMIYLLVLSVIVVEDGEDYPSEQLIFLK